MKVRWNERLRLPKPSLFWLLMRFVMSLAQTMALPFLTVFFLNQLALTPSKATFIVSLSSLAIMLFTLIGNALNETFGHKRMYIVTLSVLILTFIGYATLTNYVVLCAIAVIEGMAWAVNYPLNQTFLTQVTPDDQLERVFGYNHWVNSISRMNCPVIGVSLGAGKSPFPLYLLALVFMLVLPFAIGFLRRLDAAQIKN
jgi:MFS family permease